MKNYKDTLFSSSDTIKIVEQKPWPNEKTHGLANIGLIKFTFEQVNNKNFKQSFSCEELSVLIMQVEDLSKASYNLKNSEKGWHNYNKSCIFEIFRY